MKYFSMFSGIGGFELGIQQGGGTTWECIGFSEIDKYAIQIYSRHFPTHKNFGDAFKINPEDIGQFNLLIAGFPCQSFSIAGQRKGFADTRGTLFFEICRIAENRKPRYILLENVKGLLNHDEGRTFGTIIQSLSELGYDCQWNVLNSKFYGVPQNRERVFIIGHLRETSRPEIFPLGKGNGTNEKASEQAISTINAGYYKSGSHQPYIADFRNDEGLRIRNESLSPTLATRKHSETDVSTMPPLVLSHWPRAGNPDDGGTGPLVSSDFSFAIDSSPHLLLPKAQASKIRRLTPIECERLQGFPDGWTEGVSDTQRYKCLGNAVTVNVIKAIFEKWIKNGNL